MRFDSYHPGLNLLYFTVVLSCGILLRHPVFVGICFVCALLYCGALTGRWGRCLWALPLSLVIALWYAGYHHFGVTLLGYNFIGNRITLESAAKGLAVGMSASGCILWLVCLHTIFTADKTVYLFGRISPRLSLFLAIILRMAPRIREIARRVHTSRQGIGRGRGPVNYLRLISGLVTWTLDTLFTAAASMRCRGYSLPGRTAFSIYRFDDRDRCLTTVLFALLTSIIMAVLLGQTWVSYDPRILMAPITPLSFLFYGGFALFCLLPLLLQLWGEARFRRLRRGAGTPPV